MATPAEIDEGMLNRARFAVKLSAVQGKVHNITKSERNSAQGYNYASTESIFAMVRPLLVEGGLAVVMTTRAVELVSEQITDKQGNPATESGAHVSLDVTLIDTDTGYSETMTFDGFGKDRGDKAMPKAYTMAAKYWARTAFMIDLQADAERESQSRQSQPPRQAPPPVVIKPIPPAPRAVEPRQAQPAPAPVVDVDAPEQDDASVDAPADLPASPQKFFDLVNAHREQRNQATYDRPVIILETLKGEGGRPDFRWEHLQDADTRAWAYRVAMAHVRSSEKQLA